MTDAEILGYIKQAGANWGDDGWFGAFKTAIEAAVLAEREQCAKVCDNVVSNKGYVQAEYCAAAIRGMK